MKIVKTSIVLTLMTATLMAGHKVDSEAALKAAFDHANSDTSIHKIILKKGVHISLHAPLVYTGTQNLTIVGNGAVLDGENAGTFVFNEDMTATTNDATLLFKTASSVTIRNLDVINSATRAITVEVPKEAKGNNMKLKLNHVNVQNSALYGVHIDDNDNAFDDGDTGSDIGVTLIAKHSTFIDNGVGAIDFDGIRVDERGKGNIIARFSDCIVEHNGGDGIELDEAGEGSVLAHVRNSTFENNGFYNESDLDDAFDIDEADAGDLVVSVKNTILNNNMDEGLDFDEAGEGSIIAVLTHLEATDTTDEGIKLDEEDKGNIFVKMNHVSVKNGGDDGIQLTELGEGLVWGSIKNTEAIDNKKYGIKIEQWYTEDETENVESQGFIRFKNTELSGNGKGNDIKLHQVISR